MKSGLLRMPSLKSAILCSALLAINTAHSGTINLEEGNYVDRVNMFLGTASSAQCSPAAIRLFGMVSPGPFNNMSPCGYNMKREELFGFNHTHLQGTGCGSYGVLVLLPTTGNKELGTTVSVPATKQSAQPGYYKAII